MGAERFKKEREEEGRKRRRRTEGGKGRGEREEVDNSDSKGRQEVLQPPNLCCLKSHHKIFTGGD